jgi:hypothetical protein
VGTVSRRRIGFLSGNSLSDRISFVVASFTDAAILVEAFATEARTGSPVASKTINASAGASPKLAKYCDDRISVGPDPAGVTYVCWVGSSTLTGLAAGTRYFLKLTQGAVVESDTSTCTAPAAGTDFDLFTVSCDLSYRQIGEDSTVFRGPGSWAAVRDIAEAYDRPSYCVFMDDLGYADQASLQVFPVDTLINDATVLKQATNKSSTSLLAYDYGLNYIAWLGMLEDTTNPQAYWGRDEYRNWCIRNIPMAFSWGDHEFFNNIGIGATASTADTTFAPGGTAWNDLVGLLRPVPAGGDIRSADVTAKHWAWELGDVKVIAADCVTNLSGGTSSTYPWSYSAFLGSNQITDLLNAANTAEPFKLLVLSYAGEHTWQPDPIGAQSPSKYNSQQAWPYIQPTEWAKMFHNAAQSPLSLMDNPKTNGASGVCVVVHGDLHDPQVTRHYGYNGADGVTGTGLRGNWSSFYIATINRTTRAMADESIPLVEGRYHRGMEMLEHGTQFYPYSAAADPLIYRPAAGRVLVEGSRSPKQMTFSLLIAEYGNETSYQSEYDAVFKVGSNRPRNHMVADRGLSLDIY